MDFTELVPGFYMGGAMTSPPMPQVQAVMNLQIEAQYQYQISPAFKAAAWLPIGDAEFPGIPWLDAAVDIVVAWRRANWSVLVHCAAGISRSGMVVTACFMKEEGLSFEKALAAVRSKRPQVNPNVYFTEGLIQYEKHLNQDPKSRIWTPVVMQGSS